MSDNTITTDGNPNAGPGDGGSVGQTQTTLVRFGASAAAARKAKGMTQHEAAVLVGVSRTYFGLIEVGKAAHLTYELARKIADLLGPTIRLDGDASRAEMVSVCEALTEAYAGRVYDRLSDELPDPEETALIRRAKAVLGADTPEACAPPPKTMDDLFAEIRRHRKAADMCTAELIEMLETAQAEVQLWTRANVAKHFTDLRAKGWEPPAETPPRQAA